VREVERETARWQGIKGDQHLLHQSLVDDGMRKGELKGEKNLIDLWYYKFVGRGNQAFEGLDGIRKLNRIRVEDGLGMIDDSAMVRSGQKDTLYH